MQKIIAHLTGRIISTNSAEAHTLYKKSWFGEVEGDKIQYSFSEALFLLEKGKLDILIKEEKLAKKELLKKLQKFDKKIQIKYPVFKDLREKGYIVKTALKFGAEFRVYEKSSRLENKHSKWIVFTNHESERLTWHEFAAKSRVANSTKKNLLLAIVDEEGDITYYEVRWLKP